MAKLTIFTATYNRAYILPELYKSLQNQTCKDFEWIVVDDGSSDETAELVKKWLSEDNHFAIRFFQEKHGGKNRAINKGVSEATGDFFFIVDSDDILGQDAVEWIYEKFPSVEDDDRFAGLSGIKAKFDGQYITEPNFGNNEFIDCSNIERTKYNLMADMAEVYKTKILRRYPFKVWHDETFVPENVVFDKIALDGYIIRWYNRKIYFCDYRDDGMVRNWDRLFRNNLIGFAMDRNVRVSYTNGLRDKARWIRNIIVFCLIKGDLSYLAQTTYPWAAYLLFPLGYRDYIRFKKDNKWVK